MPIRLPRLPFAADALQPHMSAETLKFHHGKHHRKYVDETNKRIKGTRLADAPLDEIVRRAHAKGDIELFNNASQAWNHGFLWRSLSPDSGRPDTELRKAIARSFGSLAALRKAFKGEAVAHFGSGWTWLAARDRRLVIFSTHDAGSPLVRKGIVPLLVLDLWEHAYYLDHQNERPAYVDAFLKHLANWDFAAENLAAAQKG